MTFFTRMWGFSIEQDFPPLKWMDNDFMYVRFAGTRNTKTWSKCNKYKDLKQVYFF